MKTKKELRSGYIKGYALIVEWRKKEMIAMLVRNVQNQNIIHKRERGKEKNRNRKRRMAKNEVQ